ncbi:MAG: hypothetical protein SynsKO_35150 [Synoicihabitans sp.]
MPFFRSIFRVQPEAIGRVEQRLAKRHEIPVVSPLKARLDEDGSLKLARVVNISTKGVRLAMDGKSSLTSGDDCVVQLLAEDLILPLRSTVANTSFANETTELGLEFDDNSFERRQDLIQLLEPIEVGASLQEVDAKEVTQTEPGLVARRFFSARSSSLTLWENISDESLQGFELRVQDFFIRSGSEPPDLKVYHYDGDQGLGYSAPTLQQASEVTGDVKRFFKWFVPHINPRTPAEIKELLSRYVV